MFYDIDPGKSGEESLYHLNDTNFPAGPFLLSDRPAATSLNSSTSSLKRRLRLEPTFKIIKNRRLQQLQQLLK